MFVRGLGILGARMPDISMCLNHECTLRKYCYRYRAKPEPYGQSYADFIQNRDGTCDDFWDAREYVQDRLMPFTDDEDLWFLE